MKLKVEVSRPHYHPGPDFDMKVTKLRNLSVPPHWATNERIEKDGKSYRIIMPPRYKELYEERQEVHIHMPQYTNVELNGKLVKVRVKLEPYIFEPVIHMDVVDAQFYDIKGGEEFDL